MENVSRKYSWYNSCTAIVKNLHGAVANSNFVNFNILGEKVQELSELLIFDAFEAGCYWQQIF
jgi:hypothetical protein